MTHPAPPARPSRPTGPDPTLRSALDALDAALAPFTERPHPQRGCTHCYSPADLAALGGPASAVPDELVRSVADEDPDHWDGFQALYRRMTPRILRLLTTGRLHADPAVVAARLLAAGLPGRAAPERAAVAAVWSAWWHSTLRTHPADHHVTEVLEAVAAATGTLTPWLAVWTGTRTEAADLHLADALDRWLPGDGLADLRLGPHGGLHATPVLLPWLLSLDEGRIGAAQLFETERIAYS
ncbi:hypothetical protein ACFCX4_13245 [Kitasatospora sp. NPDC056327]|uniref:hypothetical protein n=1 Tax=Kitasatospora sp. NPDC056327 TaxID=3345785 RepID=UPI0035E3A536